MNFNSFEFGLFFLIVYALYLSLGHRWQNRLLLAASYIFYSFWDWRFLGLILFSTATDFLCALGIGINPDRQYMRKRFLWLSVGVNLSVLFFFKYFNFFIDNFVALFSLFGVSLHLPTWRIVLPVGISFYTFQTLSYTIDVYRRQVEPTRRFGDYALYVAFFPQLVAGPIERAKNLLPQILTPRHLNKGDLSEGLFLIYWGLFKKIFIADNIGGLLAFSDHLPVQGEPTGGVVLVSTYAFMFQLYCDFSAYSDIARGAARLLGFDIMVNFRAPLFAPNIQETWNRWHISLTSWIRDYLYFPIALTRIGKKHMDVRLVVILTFLIMGLWHGASWNYVLWGGYNGLILAAYAVIAPRLKRWRRGIPKNAFRNRVWYVLSVLLTFHVAIFGVLFFRATSLAQIGHWLHSLFTDFAITPQAVGLFIQMMGYALPLLILDVLIYRNEDIRRLFRYPVWLRYGFLYLTFYLMAVHHAITGNFIYFQF
ncbi:MBOAT family protein [Desulfonema ishimotonii]|uniref:MBOAT family protein n=1 Tax=Desulfonema ishimotonii TaxID=45657 RepID=A0A401FUJ0_9BACT|nr:MBOAT family O-acyltransferase [Desulfonema ishimotonii]GBC60623.1 MBOAT family protein [Desulfonema ishimotonii]